MVQNITTFFKMSCILMMMFVIDEVCGQVTYGITQVAPTSSSLAAYMNIPIDYQTGMPTITQEIASIQSKNKNLKVDVTLSYHPGNVTSEHWTGDVGSGWSMFGRPMITRELVGELDEKHDIYNHFYKKEAFDDIYYFNIPGESGKFKIERNTTHNTFRLIKLSSFTSKVEYAATGNNATLIIDSFTITDKSGIKYIFNDKNLSMAKVHYPFNLDVHIPPGCTPDECGGYALIASDKLFNSGFSLTAVVDEQDQPIVNYNYLTDDKFIGLALKSRTKKLSEIEIVGKGKIKFLYTQENLLPALKHDKFRLSQIMIQTTAGTLISSFNFTYSTPSFTAKRLLGSVLEKDQGGNIVAKHSYQYSDVAMAHAPQRPVRVLTRKTLPTGGSIGYTYDYVPYYKYEIPNPYPYTDHKINLPNTYLTSFSDQKVQAFTLTENKKVFFSVVPNELINHAWSINFFKKIGSGYEYVPFSIGPVVQADPSYSTERSFNFQSGEYYVTINSVEMPNPNFSQVLMKSHYIVPEYNGQTTITIPASRGLLRINQISYGDINHAPILENFSYEKFNAPGEDSGEFYFDGYYTVSGIDVIDYEDSAHYLPLLVYKNVKVFDDKGHRKFYYQTADDYHNPNSEIQWPYYDVVKKGLLQKIETYNDNNVMLRKESHVYELMQLPHNFALFSVGLYQSGPLYRSSYIKNVFTTTLDYLSSGELKSTRNIYREHSINFTNSHLNDVQHYDNISKEENIYSSGEILETNYKYAHELSNQYLVGKKMVGIPLEITTIKRKDSTDSSGRIISQLLTKYPYSQSEAGLKTNGLPLPYEILSRDLGSANLKNEVSYTKYNPATGNLQEYKIKDVTPVSVIWGYNNTQPIAKIEGATYSQVQQLAAGIIAASDSDAGAVPNSDETALLTALDNFRRQGALLNFQITTYTYDPLIGVRSITPPSGIREVYIYDAANRLKEIREGTQNGNILKEYKYNYKQ